MAEVGHTARYIAKGVVEVVWANVSNGDQGVGFDGHNFPDKTVIVKGADGTGGGVAIQGGHATAGPSAVTGWVALVDPQGNALDMSADTAETLLDNPRWVRPAVTSGDADTSYTIVLICGGAK